jgi:hypothetical protein
MMPLNIGALEGMKAFGIDLMGRHRGDFPPDYLQRIDAGRSLSAMDLAGDQAIRIKPLDSGRGSSSCAPGGTKATIVVVTPPRERRSPDFESPFCARPCWHFGSIHPVS